MFADVSSWELTIPSGTSNVKDGDDEIRRMKTLLDDGLQTEHYWTDSGLSGGQHKPGSSRLSYGSAGPPLTGDEGRIFYHVAANELIIQGSSATTAMGSAGGLFIKNIAVQTIPTHTKSYLTMHNTAIPDIPNLEHSMYSSLLTQVVIQQPGTYLVQGDYRMAGLESMQSTQHFGLWVTTLLNRSEISGSPMPSMGFNALVQVSSVATIAFEAFQTSGSGQNISTGQCSIIKL